MELHKKNVTYINSFAIQIILFMIITFAMGIFAPKISAQETAKEKEYRQKLTLLHKLWNSDRKRILGEWTYTRDWDTMSSWPSDDDILAQVHADIKFKKNGFFEETREIALKNSNNVIYRFNYYASGNYEFKFTDEEKIELTRENQTIQPANETAIKFMASQPSKGDNSYSPDKQTCRIDSLSNKGKMTLSGLVWIPLPLDREGTIIDNLNQSFGETIVLYRK